MRRVAVEAAEPGAPRSRRAPGARAALRMRDAREECRERRDAIAERIRRCWGKRLHRLDLALHFENGVRLSRPYAVERTLRVRVT